MTLRILALVLWCLLTTPAFAWERTEASWYSTEACRWNVDPVRCPTASGKSLYDLEREQPYFVASWAYPLGTVLQVCHVSPNSTCVRVVVEDRGPAKRVVRQGRALDLSKQAFLEVCGGLEIGVCPVVYEVVDEMSTRLERKVLSTRPTRWGRVDAASNWQIITLEEHEYIVNVDNWKSIIHNENCPCKRRTQ